MRSARASASSTVAESPVRPDVPKIQPRATGASSSASGPRRWPNRPRGPRPRSAWLRLARVNRDSGRREPWIMDAIRGLYCLFNVSKVQNDGTVSRLHVLTAVLLLTFSAMVSMKQAVGNPIDCVHTRDIPVEAFNAYCWIHSTYFVTGAMLGVAGVNVAFPGVGSTLLYHYRRPPSHHSADRAPTDSVTRQVKYYQWVPFFLIFQILRFQCYKISYVTVVVDVFFTLLYVLTRFTRANNLEKCRRQPSPTTVS